MLRHFGVALVAVAGLSLGSSVCSAQSALLDIPRDSQHCYRSRNASASPTSPSTITVRW